MSFLGAVEGGLELGGLKELSIGSGFGGRAGGWDPASWRAVLAAAPSLTKLTIDYTALTTSERASEVPVRVTAPTQLATTAVTSLDLSGFPASHCPAVANLANAFGDLTDLSLCANTRIMQPDVISALRLPNLRSLSFQWLVENEIRCVPLVNLELRHFPQLEHVSIATAICSSAFEFLLPASVTRVTCEVWNTVPLDALIKLVEPGPHRPPNLKHIKLDLAFGDCYPFPVGHSEDEMATWHLEEMFDDLPRWTDEVSRAGLTRLLRVAERHGVEISGTATAAFDFERAVLRRMHAGHTSDMWDQDDLDDIYDYWDEETYLDDEMDSTYEESDDDHGSTLVTREMMDEVMRDVYGPDGMREFLRRMGHGADDERE